MQYGWEFPINAEGGQREGLNNHGMESFKDDKYNHLAREIIQNSLDAAVSDVSTVTVKFTKHIVSTDEIPDVESLKNVFRQLMSEEKDDKYYHFYENALVELEQENLPILKISDYGTTGLTGVNNSSKSQIEDWETDWESLILNSGSSYKPDGAGGTYGLGKNAPFLMSKLYSIIYSTRTNETIPGKGLMGVSKLASHLNKNNEMTRAVGYFRNTEDYKKPYSGDKILPNLVNRNESGTDIIILGFTDEDDWVDQIVQSVLKNFFVRILRDGLEVEVEDIKINKNTIDGLMDKYRRDKDNKVNADYYEAYINQSTNTHRKIIPIRDLGSIELRVFLDGSSNRRVLMTRDQGMKIKYITRFSRMVHFTAVGVVEGEELNNILRKCEPPAHNDWKAGYYRGDRSEGEIKGILAEIRREVRKYINSFEEIDESEEIELDGLSDILGFLDESEKTTKKLSKDGSGIQKVARLRVKSERPDRKEEKVFDVDGNTLKKPTRKKKPKKRKLKPEKQIQPLGNLEKRATVQQVRVVGNPELKEYLIFFTPKTSGKLRLSIRQEGFNASKYTRMLGDIIRLDMPGEIEINRGVTDEFEVEKNEQVRLKLNLTDSRMSKLEVKVHEN